MEARAGRQHLLRVAERLEQLRDVGEPCLLQARVVVRLALEAGCVREQPPERRRVRSALDVLVERVLEIELPGVAQLHDRRRCECLRDRAEPVLRVRGCFAGCGHVGGADRRLPDELAVAHDRSREARQSLVMLRGLRAALELGGESVRR